jgi:hypothetical protein
VGFIDEVEERRGEERRGKGFYISTRETLGWAHR